MEEEGGRDSGALRATPTHFCFVSSGARAFFHLEIAMAFLPVARRFMRDAMGAWHSSTLLDVPLEPCADATCFAKMKLHVEDNDIEGRVSGG